MKVEFDDGEYHFDELIEESGYSVAHLVIWEEKFKERIISTLNNYYCGVNTHIAENYIVVSIPPEIIYKPIREFLQSEKELGNIDFRDCLSKIHSANI